MTVQSDWHPLELFWLLAAITLLSGAFPLQIKGVRASGTALGLVLTAVLVNPLAAALLAAATCVLQVAVHRLGWASLICNLAAYSIYAVAGGAVVIATDALALDGGSLSLAGVAFIAFLVSNLANFLVVAFDIRFIDGIRMLRSLRDIYGPVIPVQVVSALLTAALAFAYEELGVAAIMLLAIVGLVFQYVLHLAFESMARGEQVDERNQELASLQVGLISTMLKTLSLRDHMTARHSAAVARYSRAIAEALGVPEREQELIHTAALFHDIGKFIFPDSILRADRKLSDEDYAIVKQHPEVGAELIGEIEGYGPVATIVRHHHERIDGRGYPEGIIGDAIPLGSRIISVADVYDVITARDTYRTPVTVAEAFAELRRVAGSQLDAHIVEVFIDLVQSKGVAFRHSTAADFEAELQLEVRVRDYAAPRVAA